MDNINLNRENGQKLWAADWNKLVSTINLIIDAVNNQNNLPGITKLSQLINDSGFITQEDVRGKVNKGELAEVATSGSYNDLKDKPSQMTGPQGPEGKSAYQVAVQNGFIGTPQLWLNSLKGEPGQDGVIGLDGADGKSAYDLAVELGYEGTLELWLESLHGQDGQNGSNGTNGNDGITPHIDSTSKHWIIGSTDTGVLAEGLNGTNGTDGKSAYQSYLDTTMDNPPLTELQWANNDYNNLKNKPNLATVATSGSYNDLRDTPLNNFFLGHEYVEIAGIKWATMNVGATDITDYGLYFLWGDTQGYTAEQVGVDKIFNKNNLKYYLDGLYIKYNDDDHLIELQPSDDAVTAAWGTGWRIPTTEEFVALSAAIDYIDASGNIIVETDKRTTLNGVTGLYVADKTDHSKRLFFPATGWCSGNTLGYLNDNGQYLSSSLSKDIEKVCVMYFYDEYTSWHNNYIRSMGCTVRGVVDDLSTAAYTGNYSDLNNKPGGLIANGHEYVEIGGIKWATMNIGANGVTDVGLYFQWADTQGYTVNQVGSGSGKKYFGWNDYEYSWDSSGNFMTKYESNSNITELEAIDDAVQAAWGGSWRMPTIEEFLILSENTYVAYESNYLNSGISGLLLTDKKDSDKQLFFPYTGYAREGNMYSVDQGSEGEGGYYWSKSRYIYDDVYAHYSYLNYSRPNWYNKNSRKAGFVIRGVIDGYDEFHKAAFTGNYNDLNNRPYTFNENNHTYVDLGLPSGTMWATMNVGALSETDYGNYYKYGRGSNNFQTDDHYSTSYDGTEDPLSINFDTASQVWGGDWHMPTKELLEELVANTTYTWETNFKNSGINGGKFRSRNGNYIFFPAAGYYDYNNNGNLGQVGILGGIWSSSPRINAGAYGFYYGSEEKGVSNTWRMNGLSVRPVLNRLYNFSKSAFTGDYNDLINKPTIPTSSGTSTQIQADWDLSDNTALDYIKNKPTIPAALVQSDWNATTGMGAILNKPTIPAAQVQSDWNATTGLGVILNKPTIPTVPANETATSGGSTLSVVTTGDKYNWNNKANVWQGTQALYDALSPNYDSNTIYIITATS